MLSQNAGTYAWILGYFGPSGVPFGRNMGPKCSKMVSQSRLRLSLGDFGGKMPSPKRPWEAKGSPKGCQREDLGVVLGSKSCENCQLVQTVDFVKIELSCTRELNFRGPRRSEYHQNVNLVVVFLDKRIKVSTRLNM